MCKTDKLEQKRKYHREYQMKRRANKKANGICMNCSELALPGRLRCKKHNDIMLADFKQRRKTERGKITRRKIEAANKQRRRRRGTGRYKSVKHFVKLKGKKQWGLSEIEYLQLIIEPCYYCGLENTSVAGVGLDRLDNSIGYILKNVVSCCTECNRAKSDKFTSEEMKIIGKAICEVKLARDQ